MIDDDLGMTGEAFPAMGPPAGGSRTVRFQRHCSFVMAATQHMISFLACLRIIRVRIGILPSIDLQAHVAWNLCKGHQE
jgi:hypothetical protein